MIQTKRHRSPLPPTPYRRVRPPVASLFPRTSGSFPPSPAARQTLRVTATSYLRLRRNSHGRRRPGRHRREAPSSPVRTAPRTRSSCAREIRRRAHPANATVVQGRARSWQAWCQTPHLEPEHLRSAKPRHRIWHSAPSFRWWDPRAALVDPSVRR